MSLAWHIAKLVRAEKIPELKTLLSASEPAAPQTPEQHFAIFAAMAVQSQRMN